MRKSLLKKTEIALENLNKYLSNLEEINVEAKKGYYSDRMYKNTSILISEGYEFKEEILRVLHIIKYDKRNILDVSDALTKINIVNTEILDRMKKLNYF